MSPQEVLLQRLEALSAVIETCIVQVINATWETEEGWGDFPNRDWGGYIVPLNMLDYRDR